jgi:hypothetical protein
MAAAAPLDSAATAAPAGDLFPFAALPPALALRVFAAVPADTRLRCAEVCTGWCALLAERSLWTRLDLSDTSGVTHWKSPALLRAAAAKAGGALTALDVSGMFYAGALRETVAANAGALRELRCCRLQWIYKSLHYLETLLSAAPQLRVCEADVDIADAAKGRRALRNEGVFGPLRVQTAAWLSVDGGAATLVSLFADVAAHASLAELRASVPHAARRA